MLDGRFWVNERQFFFRVFCQLIDFAGVDKLLSLQPAPGQADFFTLSLSDSKRPLRQEVGVPSVRPVESDSENLCQTWLKH
jgi:hypothetical protein